MVYPQRRKAVLGRLPYFEGQSKRIFEEVRRMYAARGAVV